MANRGLAELKARAHAVERHTDVRSFLAGRYGLEFDSRGRSRCPCSSNHTNGDADPSFTVTEDGHARCWSQECFGPKGTDLFGLLQVVEGVGFRQAIELVAGAGTNGNGAVQTASCPPRHVNDKSHGGQVVAEYVYADSQGGPVLKVQRIEGPNAKRFAQHSPDGKGGWRLGAKGVRAPLYRLPELRDADDPVVVVEGEKCADALAAIGVNATTCAGGAGKWQSEHTESLKGREVVVWPDNDPPGRRHAESVCAALSGTAAAVRWIEPPEDLPDKGDAADLVALPGGEDRARELIEGARLWAEERRGGPRLICMADVTPETPSWLWHPRIPSGELTLLFGDGGVGKTHAGLAIAAALSLACGLPDAEAPGTPSAAVVFTGEDSLGETRRRLDAMGANPQYVFACGEPFGLDAEGLAFVERSVREKHAVFALIDPVVAFLGKDLDLFRANEVRSVLAPLAALAHETGAAVMLSTHVTKGSTARAAQRAIGSGDFVNAARSALLAGSDPDDPDQCALCHVKANLGPLAPPLGYSIRDGRFAWLASTTLTPARILGAEATDDDRQAGAQAEELVREMCRERVRAADVIAQGEAEGISKRTMQRAASKLCRREREGVGTRTQSVFWTLNPVDAT